jgi:GTP cyclohydrolase I
MENNIAEIMTYLGEDITREGLVETPKRVRKALLEVCAGYTMDPKEVFKTFDSNGYDQIVLLKNVHFFSMCEHHMFPFYGTASIAYIPNKRVIGISKLARLLEIYSKRLQIQERLCEQITSDLEKYLQPKGSACVIKATHMCMNMRGIKTRDAEMVTSSLKGVFLEEPSCKAELFNMLRGV